MKKIKKLVLNSAVKLDGLEMRAIKGGEPDVIFYSCYCFITHNLQGYISSSSGMSQTREGCVSSCSALCEQAKKNNTGCIHFMAIFGGE